MGGMLRRRKWVEEPFHNPRFASESHCWDCWGAGFLVVLYKPLD